MPGSGYINRWFLYGSTHRQMHELLGLQTGVPKRENHRCYQGISLSGMRLAAGVTWTEADRVAGADSFDRSGDRARFSGRRDPLDSQQRSATATLYPRVVANARSDANTDANADTNVDAGSQRISRTYTRSDANSQCFRNADQLRSNPARNRRSEA